MRSMGIHPRSDATMPRVPRMTLSPDRVYETEGGRVACDTISLEFLRGATLEFEDTLMRAAFTVGAGEGAGEEGAEGADWREGCRQA